MKTKFNARHFLLVVLLFSFGLLLAGQYFSTPLIKTYTDIAFCITALGIAIVVYLFIKEINRAARLHAELYLREVYLRETLNSLEEGVITTDMHGIIQGMNPSAENLTGWKSNEAIGLTLEKIYDVVNEETGLAFEHIVSRILKKGQTIDFENNTILRKKDGGQIIISNSGSPVRNAEGNLVGAVLAFRDLTEIKQAKEKLSANERRFSALFEKSTEMITLANEQGKVIYGSPSITKHFGYSSEEILNTFIQSIIHPDDLPLFAQKRKEILNAPGQSFFSQHRMLHKNGDWIWCEGTITNLLNEPGIRAMVGNFRDITQRKNAEDKLKETHEELVAAAEKQHSILDALPANIALLNGDGVIVEVNEAWIKFGNENNLCSPQHNIGDNYITIAENATGYEELEGKQIAEGIRQVIAGSIPSFAIEYPCHSPVEQRWFKVQVAPLMKEHDSGAVVMHINVTERTLVTTELQQSHNLIAKLTDQVPVAVYQFEMTADGKMSFPFMGKGIERLMPGMTPEKVKSDAAIPFSQIHPDDLPAFLVSIEHSRQNLNLWEEEYRIIEPDGQYKWMLASSRPEKKEDGTVVWYGYIQDITERKKAEEKIHFDANLLNVVGEAVIATDLNGAIIYWNKAAQQIYGWTEKEVSGRNVVDVISAQISVEMGNEIMNQLASGKTWSGEYLVLRKDGSEFWAFVSDFPIHNDKGELIAIMGVSRDITEEKSVKNEIIALNEHLEEKVNQRTAELTEANQALEAFSYSVSHDLRAPLRSVMGFTRIIQKDYANSLPQDAVELFGHIDMSTKRMNSIIEDLLKLARVGKSKLNLGQLETGKLFQSIWDNMSFAAPHKTTLSMPPLPKILADASMIEQVIVNLLSNAIKYSSKKEAPHVEVGYEEKDEWVTFFVKDNGAGFDMKNYDRLFGAFQRLHGMSEFEGTGVGLMIVKRIIEKHGGTIWAKAKVNEGATFYFTLPKAERELILNKDMPGGSAA